MERKKAVKLITVMLMAVVLTMSLVITCPSFSITSKAAENDTATWSISSRTALKYYRYSLGYKTLVTVDFDLPTAWNQLFATPQKYQLPDNVKTGGKLYITYPEFTYGIEFTSYSHMTNKETALYYTPTYDIKPYLVDNLGNQYLLDSQNGGMISINDPSGITDFTFMFLGHVSGSVCANGNAYMSYLDMKESNQAFNIDFSLTPQARTITDSEGTVWTVPDGVENPVVIRYGSTNTQKLLLDGVSGLGYFQNPKTQDTEYVLGSAEYIDVNLYDIDEISHKALLREDYAETLGIEPVFCTHMWHFTDFLYGSLPEMEVTLLPAPTNPPTPTNPPAPDELVDLGEVKIGENENGEMIKEGTVYCKGGMLTFRTKYGNRDYNEYHKSGDPCYVHIEDNCSKFIGRFTLNADGDGYVSMMFPDLWLYPEITWPDSQYFVDQIDENESDAQILKLFESAEPIVILYANGERYNVSPYGGNVRIPVNEGENIVIMEIVLQVKDDFAVKPAQALRVVYECYLEDFAVYIREFKDSVTSAVEDIKETLENQLEESKKQTDALTKYEGADKMQSDNDKLSGAIKDYDEVSNSLFESAGDSISDFDLGSAFEYGSSLISAFGFLATVITSIIQQMGYFSMLYPLGVAMVIIGALLGLSKYMTSPGPGEMPKDDHPYRPDPTQLRLPDKRHSEHRKK